MRRGYIRVDGGDLQRACRTETLSERLLGLMGTHELPYGDVMWLDHCDSIHTAFMRYPIDICFSGRDGLVTGMSHGVAPWRMRLHLGAAFVLETRAGWLDKLGIKKKSRIEWVNNESL